MKRYAGSLACLLASSILPSTALAAGTAGCTLENGKIISLDSLDTAPTYRYGTAEKEEMTLTAGQRDVKVYKGSAMFSGGGASYVRFSTGPYSYVAYSGLGKGWDFTGLVVYKHTKIIMRKSCKGHDNALSIDVNAVNAPEDPSSDDFEGAPF